MRREPPSSQVDWGRSQAPYPQLGNQDLPSKFASRLHLWARAVPRIVRGTHCALLLLVAAKRGRLSSRRRAPLSPEARCGGGREMAEGRPQERSTAPNLPSRERPAPTRLDHHRDQLSGARSGTGH